MIDLSRLSRDYTKIPLGKMEKIPKEDLEYLYMELNLSSFYVGEFFHRTPENIQIWCNKYGLKKTKQQVQESKKQTFLKRFGTDNPAKSQEIKDKTEATNLKKYGCKAPAQNKDVLNKMKQTSLDRYGAENIMQTSVGKERLEKTNLERYGSKYYTGTKDFHEKSKNTCQNKYNADNWMKSDEGKAKFHKVMQENYGVNCNSQRDEVKAKLLEKGKESYKKGKIKRNITNISKYGSVFMFGSKYFKVKSKQTFLSKYGVDNPSKNPDVVKKIFTTKKKNGTIGNKSKQEDMIFDILKNSFPMIERQYRSDEYPFSCDFYIPELDLYIEYQGHWSHGHRPFDDSEINKKQLAEWQEKAKTSKFYENAIHTWTVADVQKRECGKNLNWLEFFSLSELLDWLQSVSNICEN